MSIASLTEFKQFLRELTNDLDDTFQMALDSATAEVNHFLGFDAEDEFGSGMPADIEMACMTLALIHADVGDPEQNDHRRTAAQSILVNYRRNTGFGRLPDAES